jgi:Mor family transcriptional regulator
MKFEPDFQNFLEECEIYTIKELSKKYNVSVKKIDTYIKKNKIKKTRIQAKWSNKKRYVVNIYVM